MEYIQAVSNELYRRKVICLLRESYLLLKALKSVRHSLLSAVWWASESVSEIVIAASSVWPSCMHIEFDVLRRVIVIYQLVTAQLLLIRKPLYSPNRRQKFSKATRYRMHFNWLIVCSYNNSLASNEAATELSLKIHVQLSAYQPNSLAALQTHTFRPVYGTIYTKDDFIE